MRKFVRLLALASVPVLWGVVGPAQEPAREATAPRYSQEKLDRIRESLTAQIAVHDTAEGAMRAPTPAEAAALAAPAAQGTGETTALPGGGTALRADGSQLSFLVATIGADGKVNITHASAADAARMTKGGGHVR